MRKLGFWVIIAVLGIGYLAGGKDEKSPARAPALKSAPIESNTHSFGFTQATRTQRSMDTPTAASQSPDIGTTMYAAQRANMRAEPTTKSRIITVIDKGHIVKVLNIRNDWHSIEYRNRTGWISSRLLASEKPIIKPAPTATRTLPAQAAAPVRQNRSGQPTRRPYVGTCDCPYDLMRNGRQCGGRSAYSRPGGRNPQCYF